MKKNKKVLSFLLAFAMILGLASPVMATTWEEGVATPPGSITINLRNIETMPTEDQDISGLESPAAGTIGYKLYRVADYDADKGYFVDAQGDEYTRVNLDGIDEVSSMDKIEEFPEVKNTPDQSEIKFENLPLGRYVAIQTLKNEGTVEYNHFMVDVPGFSKDGSGVVDKTKFVKDIVVFPKNTLKLSEITIKKVDGDSNLFVEGAKVTIEKTSGTLAETNSLHVFEGKWYVVDSTGSRELLIPEEGLTISGLDAGEYLIKEVETPAGYTLNTEEFTIVIGSNREIELLPKEGVNQDIFATLDGTSRTLTIKNYEEPTVSKELDTEVSNQIENQGDAYFDPATSKEVKWDLIGVVPRNFKDYTKYTLTDTPQVGMKFKEFESVMFGSTELIVGNDYTVTGSTMALTADGIAKVAGLIPATGEVPKLIAKAVVEFDHENFDWDVLKHENTVTLTHKFGQEDDKTVEHTPDEKMVTGTLEITKTLKGDPLENIKPSDVEFKVYRMRTKTGEEPVKEYLTLEQRADGIWYPTGVVADKASATVLSPAGDANANTSESIKVYGLLISDTKTNLEHAEYYVEEVRAPQGYNPITKPIKVTVNGPLEGDLRAVLGIENRAGLELPVTGGAGVAIGLVVLAGLGAWAYSFEKKRKENQ